MYLWFNPTIDHAPKWQIYFDYHSLMWQWSHHGSWYPSFNSKGTLQQHPWDLIYFSFFYKSSPGCIHGGENHRPCFIIFHLTSHVVSLKKLKFPWVLWKGAILNKVTTTTNSHGCCGRVSSCCGYCNQCINEWSPKLCLLKENKCPLLFLKMVGIFWKRVYLVAITMTISFSQSKL